MPESFTPVQGTPYYILPAADNSLYLTVSSNIRDYSHGTLALLNNTIEQKFTFVPGKIQGTWQVKSCLYGSSVYLNFLSKQNGCFIKFLKDNNQNQSQSWKLSQQGKGQIKNSVTIKTLGGQYLDLQNTKRCRGSQAIIWEKSGMQTQYWKIIPVQSQEKRTYQYKS